MNPIMWALTCAALLSTALMVTLLLAMFSEATYGMTFAISMIFFIPSVWAYSKTREAHALEEET